MKNFLLPASAVLLTVPALAADLPRRAAAPAPAPVFAAMNWTGFYVGAQVGYAWQETGIAQILPSNARVVSRNSTAEAEGLVGGLHAGYNLQYGAFVVGVEADAELSDLRGVSPFFLPLTGVFHENRVRASLRARLGVAFDRALLYVTGGLAAGQMEYSYGRIIAPPSRVSGKSWEFGWTLGAGVEYALSPNWSMRAEYRYTDFGEHLLPLPVAIAAPAGNRIAYAPTDHSARLGLTYRFGGAATPVVARY